jgi:hypothetical protein
VAQKPSNDYDGDSDEITLDEFLVCQTKNEYFVILEVKLSWANLYSKTHKKSTRKLFTVTCMKTNAEFTFIPGKRIL